MPQQVVPILVAFLHNVFTVLWIGGLLIQAWVVLPAIREALGQGPQTAKLLNAIQRRLTPVIYVCIIGLWVTGTLLSLRAADYPGFLAFGNRYSMLLTSKHILVIGMVILALVRSLLLRRAPAAGGPGREQLMAGLLFANVVLALGVLFLSGWISVVGSPLRPPR